MNALILLAAMTGQCSGGSCSAPSSAAAMYRFSFDGGPLSGQTVMVPHCNMSRYAAIASGSANRPSWLQTATFIRDYNASVEAQESIESSPGYGWHAIRHNGYVFQVWSRPDLAHPGNYLWDTALEANQHQYDLAVIEGRRADPKQETKVAKR